MVYARYESKEAFNHSDGSEVQNAHLRLRCIFKSDQNIVGDVIRIFMVYFPKEQFLFCHSFLLD